MLVVASSKVSEKKRVYHKLGCVYAKRIKQDNRLEISNYQAEERCYHECKHCSGLRGDVRTHKKNFHAWTRKYNMKFTYSKRNDILYVQTNIGFWKIFMREEVGGYLLFHRNTYSADMDFNKAINGDFHRQRDVKITNSLDKLVDYIVAHDRAKLTILVDYRNLPNRTKKQRKYYRAAERKEKRKAIRRLDCIFASIASAQPSAVV